MMFRECKRNNLPYRQEALAQLGKFVELRANRDLFGRVLEITEPVIREALDGAVEMDIDSPSGDQSSRSTCVQWSAYAP